MQKQSTAAERQFIKLLPSQMIQCLTRFKTEMASLTHLFKWHYFRLMLIYDNHVALYIWEAPIRDKLSYYSK